MVTWRVGGEHWGYYSNSLQDYGRVTALYLVVRPRASPLYSEWWWWWWCGLLFCLLTASCCSQSSPTSKQSSMSFCHYKCYCYSPQGYGRVTAPYLEVRQWASLSIQSSGCPCPLKLFSQPRLNPRQRLCYRTTLALVGIHRLTTTLPILLHRVSHT